MSPAAQKACRFQGYSPEMRAVLFSEAASGRALPPLRRGSICA